MTNYEWLITNSPNKEKLVQLISDLMYLLSEEHNICYERPPEECLSRHCYECELSWLCEERKEENEKAE